jgi:FkbM family methyltransferase
MIHLVSQLHKNLAHRHYQLQKNLADLTPNFAISGTPYSTLTINRNFRTAIHQDSGDFEHGLSAILVAEEGKYHGGFLGYPQFGVCVDLRNRDFLLKDPHQYHCNTEIIPITKDYMRMSMIFYYRQGISKCASNAKNQTIKPPKNLSNALTKLPNVQTKLTKAPIKRPLAPIKRPLAPIKRPLAPTKLTKTQITLPQALKKTTKVTTLPKKQPIIPMNLSQSQLQLFGGGGGDSTSIHKLNQPNYIWYEVNPKIKNTEIQSVTSLSLLIRPETTDIKVIDEVMIRDVYELKKLDFWIEPQDYWLDLGANIGTFTLMCLSRGAKVISYEPEEENFQLLETNIKTNFNTGFTLHQKAVGATNGQVPLYLCKGDYNKYRHTIYPKRGRESVQIPMESIHSVLAKNRQITAIKIDIEGAEIDILESMKLSDWRKTQVKKMVFEYSFDIDPSIPRFLKIVENLRLYFDLVHYTKVKEDEEFYKHFPAMTMVYCLKF